MCGLGPTLGSATFQCRQHSHEVCVLLHIPLSLPWEGAQEVNQLSDHTREGRVPFEMHAHAPTNLPGLCFDYSFHVSCLLTLPTESPSDLVA